MPRCENYRYYINERRRREEAKTNTSIIIKKRKEKRGAKNLFPIKSIEERKQLSIHLPSKKTELWLKEIEALIAKANTKSLVKEQELESMIGKLNHATIMETCRNYFLSNRLRYQLKMIKLNARQHGQFDKSEVKDLQLWSLMLSCLKEGNIGSNPLYFRCLRNRNGRLLYHWRLRIRMAFRITR